MIETMKAIAKENSMCVLATVSADAIPHCSLMAYTTDEACREIYMATQKSTQKYKNLQQNPAVSLLIDTRETQFHQQIRAMTVDGVYQSTDNEKSKIHILKKLLERHPHLKDFFSHADIVFLCIKLRSFLLLNDVSESHYVKIDDA